MSTYLLGTFDFVTAALHGIGVIGYGYHHFSHLEFITSGHWVLLTQQGRMFIDTYLPYLDMHCITFLRLEAGVGNFWKPVGYKKNIIYNQHNGKYIMATSMHFSMTTG